LRRDDRSRRSKSGWRSSPIQTVEGDTEPTQKIDADGSFDQLDVGTIDALVVPGGTVNADKLRVETTAQTLVRQVAGAGKPLAVICHGPWLLVSAGLYNASGEIEIRGGKNDLEGHS